ncbi:DUF5629 family protein [Pseudomonas sp. 1176_21]|uniref:DUF5629 family protein n=1 Tax=Pseudomonas sp. 1176_21 TaxID=2604453 RepID=UPI000E27A1B1
MTTLAQALESCDMLLIDGLHAFDFIFDDTGLRIELMDGRALKKWQFSPEQIGNATLAGEHWQLSDDTGEHQLVCMSALRASEEDDDETPADVPADR